MSQSTSLSTVNGERLFDGLPVQIGKINEGEDILESFQLLVENFISVIPLHSLEDLVISKVADKVKWQLEHILDSITKVISQTQDLQEVLKRHLLACESLIKCMNSIVTYALEQAGAVEGGVVESSALHSLSNLSIALISLSYSHCKDSGQIYGQWLSIVTEELSLLFKAVHSLQMNIINLLEKMTICDKTRPDDIETLCTVLYGLQEIGSVAHCLDVKIMVSVWKAISKAACLHAASLRGHLDVGSLIAPLAENTASSFLYLSELIPQMLQDGGKAYSRNVKLVGFQMKILSSLSCEFNTESLTDAVPSICLLLISLQSHSTCCILRASEVPESCSSLLGQVAAGIDLVLQPFLPLTSFAQHCMNIDDNGWMDYPADVRCLSLLRIINILTKPENTRQIVAWCDSDNKPSLPRLIFSHMPLCHKELLSDGIISRDKSCDLYSKLILALGRLVLLSPSDIRSALEEMLLENLLSHQFFVSSLSGDVFYQVIRSQPSTVIYSYLCFFIDLSQMTLTRPCKCCHLVLLIRRLLPLLDGHLQGKLIGEYPLTSHVMVLVIDCFSERVCSDHVTSFLDRVLNELKQMCVKDMFTTEEINSLTVHLMALHKIHKSSSHLKSFETTPRYSALPDQLYSVLTSVNTDCLNDQRQLLDLLTAAIKLCSCLSAMFSDCHILEILKVVRQFLNSSPSSITLPLAVLEFLLSLASRRFTPSSEQPKILQQIAHLLGLLLSNNNPVIHQRALCVFSDYAENTPHESIVPDSLSQHPQLQEDVMIFFKQISGDGNMKEYSPDDLTEVTDVAHEFWNRPSNPKSDSSDAKLNGEEPAAKRLKLDGCETNFQLDLEQLITSCVEQVLPLQNSHVSVSSPVKTKLRILMNGIQAVLNKN